MKVLIYITQKTEFNFLLPLINRLVEESKILFFLVDFKFTDLTNVLEFAKTKGIEVQVINMPNLGQNNNLETQPPDSKLPQKKIGFSSRLKAAFLSFLKPFLYARYLRKQVSFYKILFRNKDINTVVLGQEVYENQSRLIAFAASKLKINCVIVPFVRTNKKIRFKEFSINQIPNWVGSLLQANKWILELDKKYRMRLPLNQILAWEISRLAKGRPWLYNSGYAKKVILADEEDKGLYLSEGFPIKKIKVAGAPSDDLLKKILERRTELRHQLLSNYDFNIELPIVLISVPNYFSNEKNITWESLVNTFLKPFCDCNVLLNPHPRLNKKHLDDFEGQKVKVANEMAVELIPLCDIYVVSISNLIKQASKVGIPTINFDYLKLDYQQYDQLEGVKTVFSKVDFLKVSNNIIEYLKPFRDKNVKTISKSQGLKKLIDEIYL